MEVLRRAHGKPARLGVLAGAFNPPTRAHLALAQAGLGAARVDEVLFVLPRVFPHKPYEAAGFSERLRMLQAALGEEPRYSMAASEGGLFWEIARECHCVYGLDTGLVFLCGRDTAERIVNWDYGRSGALREMLGAFELLVAARKGVYRPPEELRGRVHSLRLDGDFDEVSATVVRERIRRGESWERLVPETIVPLVREIYETPTCPQRTADRAWGSPRSGNRPDER